MSSSHQTGKIYCLPIRATISFHRIHPPHTVLLNVSAHIKCPELYSLRSGVLLVRAGASAHTIRTRRDSGLGLCPMTEHGLLAELAAQEAALRSTTSTKPPRGSSVSLCARPRSLRAARCDLDPPQRPSAFQRRAPRIVGRQRRMARPQVRRRRPLRPLVAPVGEQFRVAVDLSTLTPNSTPPCSQHMGARFRSWCAGPARRDRRGLRSTQLEDHPLVVDTLTACWRVPDRPDRLGRRLSDAGLVSGPVGG